LQLAVFVTAWLIKEAIKGKQYIFILNRQYTALFMSIFEMPHVRAHTHTHMNMHTHTVMVLSNRK